MNEGTRFLPVTLQTAADAPPGNADDLTYTANWRWDLGMYLWRFTATLHRPQGALRSVMYGNGGLGLWKFGEAEDRIREPMREMLLGRP